MKHASFAPRDDKLHDTGTAEVGYDEWKRQKIERSLASARNPASLIPAEQVWRELDAED